MHRCLDTYVDLNWTMTENLNILILKMKIETVTASQQRKTQVKGPHCWFLSIFSKKNYSSLFQNYWKTTGKKGILLNFFYEISITLIPKPKNTQQRKLNVAAKSSTKQWLMESNSTSSVQCTFMEWQIKNTIKFIPFISIKTQ